MNAALSAKNVIKTVALLSVLGSLQSCKSRNNDSNTYGVGAVQIAQSKGLGGFDGYRETALFREFFFAKTKSTSQTVVADNSAPSNTNIPKDDFFECYYTSHLRVRAQKNLYSSIEREERYIVHVIKAKSAISQEKLIKAVLKRLGLKKLDDLTLEQSRILSQVRPVSSEFVSKELASLEQEAAAIQEKLNTSIEKKGAIKVSNLILKKLFGFNDRFHGDQALHGNLAFVGAGMLVTLSGLPVVGVPMAGVHGILYGSSATITSGVNRFTRAKEQDKARLLKTIQRLQSNEGEATELIATNKSFQVYEPKFRVDELTNQAADPTIKLSELRKNKNKESMHHLGADIIELVLEDVIVSAHVDFIQRLNEKNKNPVLEKPMEAENAIEAELPSDSLLLEGECAPDVLSLDIQNDIEYADQIPSIEE